VARTKHALREAQRRLKVALSQGGGFSPGQQLTDLGYELRRKPKELHQEAFNLLFAKHGKPQIA